jgi:hypothetical protein
MQFDDTLIDVANEAYEKELRHSRGDHRGAMREALKAVLARWVDDTVRRETSVLLYGSLVDSSRTTNLGKTS